MTTTRRLSSDLITEILSRQPPKSLLRFRCASKSLCSEIDGPDFMKMHLRRSIERGSHQTLAFNIRGQVLLFEHLPDFLVKLSSATDLSPQVRPFSRRPVSYIGSCRGLVALAVETPPGVVIWNPNTRKRWMPSVPDDDGDFRKSSFGFGYDSLSDDYKLVKVKGWFLENVLDFRVGVYSFKSKSWRPVGVSAYPFPGGRSLGENGVLARGAVHFVSVRCMVYDKFEVYIRAFDLHTEKFRDVVVTLPNHEDGGLITLDVTVLGGYISIVRFGGGEIEAESTEMEAWVLKDYDGSDESWTKLFRVSLPWSQMYETKLLFESGNSFFLYHTGRCIACIDLETKSVEEVRVEAYQAIQYATLLVPSIESLGVGIADNRTFPAE